MVHLFTELSKYTMIILFALYTYQCFSALKRNVEAERQAGKFRRQVLYLYLFHLNAYCVLFLATKNVEMIKFYLAQAVFFAAVQGCYALFYRRASRLVVNNMCMLMCIGFVMLTRLSYEFAVKQFVIAAVSVAITLLIPYFISRWRFLRSLTWVYALLGITLLGVVAVLGAVSHGAKLSFSVAGVTVQPSEFIKIIFVFFVASMFYESTEFIHVVKATVVAGLHVVILVLSKDLGAALIFFIAYMVMLYVATGKLYYFAGGMLCGAAASVVAYFLFHHVRVRVVAWQDPLAVFANEGNQVSNSLFAIGTGGWFGMGLNQGMPYKIPEVKQDFIFSSISEELGGIFAVCLLLVCGSCFLMFLNIAMQIKDLFYKLVALGLGTIYGFQIFLSVGGDIKCIPSTGVTLPLVSYGGSSLLSTLIIFSIIQGLYLMRERESTEQAQRQKAGRKPGRSRRKVRRIQRGEELVQDALLEREPEAGAVGRRPARKRKVAESSARNPAQEREAKGDSGRNFAQERGFAGGSSRNPAWNGGFSGDLEQRLVEEALQDNILYGAEGRPVRDSSQRGMEGRPVRDSSQRGMEGSTLQDVSLHGMEERLVQEALRDGKGDGAQAGKEGTAAMKKFFTEKKSGASSNRKKNREFAVITYLFVGLFLILIGYFAYFQIYKSEDFINSPYNTRQETFAEHVVRGNILSADGKVLAQTLVGEDGSETRYYPYGGMFAHAVGYDSNGRAGIESFGNFTLLRSHAFFLEQVINGIKGQKNQGDNIVTTLNYSLQETAYQALGDRRGAIVALEPSTGKIVAMVSKPDFDPNAVATEWESIISDTEGENSVLVNRATQGLYPPGSTFKILTTLEYLRENPNYQQYSYECIGSIPINKTEIHCYNNAVHGTESLEASFAKSCNTSYANIGLGLDRKAFSGLCSELLFGKNLPVPYASNQSSFVLDTKSDADQVAQTAIGQGETLVTPMHMAMITAAIANGGNLMRPYVIDHTENYKGVTVQNYRASEYGSLLGADEAAKLQEFMSLVVREGTASALNGQPYQAAGKTGSAEFSNIKGESHAWFTGYASMEGKETLAVTVIVENGGAGSTTAVPIAKQLFDRYFTSGS